MVFNELDINSVIGKDVFTDRGSFCGKVSDVELDLAKFRIRTLIIDAAKGSYLASIVGGKRGVKVPYPMVQSIDDVVIIKHIKAPESEEEPEKTQ